MNLEVVVDEFGGAGVVGDDTSDPSGGADDVVGFFRGVESLHCGGIAEIEFGMGAPNEVVEAALFEVLPDGTANEASMSGDVNS